jgi:hypothetical protein
VAICSVKLGTNFSVKPAGVCGMVIEHALVNLMPVVGGCLLSAFVIDSSAM